MVVVGVMVVGVLIAVFSFWVLFSCIEFFVVTRLLKKSFYKNIVCSSFLVTVLGRVQDST
jgi:hypothetical protein